jgi:glycosyltransferase involved in cell wall biosynthesis
VSKGSKLIAFLFNPKFWPYVKYLDAHYVVFHVYDIYSKQEPWSSELESMFTNLVERADLITIVSEGLAESLPKNSNNVRVLHNAADVAMFIKAVNIPCPEDLAVIPQPRILYTGSINRKVDFNLIAEVAKYKPEWHWVLIGRVEDLVILSDTQLNLSFKTCRQLGNVHFLGEKNRFDIPGYINNANVNVMCYRDAEEEWWKPAYPLKLHEYLAAAKPVIANQMESIQKFFSNVVDTASTTAEWIAAIERALISGGVGTIAERRAVAMENSWDKRVDVLENWLFEMIESP